VNDEPNRIAITVTLRVVPRGWVVERTFGGLGRFRRMSKDYEFQTSTSESMIHAPVIGIMLRRLA
jgi:putative transposase